MKNYAADLATRSINLDIRNDAIKRRRVFAICVEEGDRIEPIGTVLGILQELAKKHVRT